MLFLFHSNKIARIQQRKQNLHLKHWFDFPPDKNKNKKITELLVSKIMRRKKKAVTEKQRRTLYLFSIYFVWKETTLQLKHANIRLAFLAYKRSFELTWWFHLCFKILHDISKRSRIPSFSQFTMIIKLQKVCRSFLVITSVESMYLVSQNISMTMF